MKKLNDVHLWHIFTMLFYGALLIISIFILYFYGKLKIDVPILDIILISLATFRLTRLVVYDSITDFIRDLLSRFETGLGKSTSQLVHCPWCMSIWMALFIVFIYFLTPIAWYFIFILAVASIVSFLQVIITLIIKITP